MGRCRAKSTPKPWHLREKRHRKTWNYTIHVNEIHVRVADAGLACEHIHFGFNTGTSLVSVFHHRKDNYANKETQRYNASKKLKYFLKRTKFSKQSRAANFPSKNEINNRTSTIINSSSVFVIWMRFSKRFAVRLRNRFRWSFSSNSIELGKRGDKRVDLHIPGTTKKKSLFSN